MSIKITPKVGFFSNTVRSVEIMGIKGWVSPSTGLLVMWKGEWVQSHHRTACYVEKGGGQSDCMNKKLLLENQTK